LSDRRVHDLDLDQVHADRLYATLVRRVPDQVRSERRAELNPSTSRERSGLEDIVKRL